MPPPRTTARSRIVVDIGNTSMRQHRRRGRISLRTYPQKSRGPASQPDPSPDTCLTGSRTTGRGWAVMLGRRGTPDDEFMAYYAARAEHLRSTAYLLCGD